MWAPEVNPTITFPDGSTTDFRTIATVLCAILGGVAMPPDAEDGEEVEPGWVCRIVNGERRWDVQALEDHVRKQPRRASRDPEPNPLPQFGPIGPEKRFGTLR